MSLIRPEVQELLWRAREVIAAAAVGFVGLWLMALGGYLLFPVGALLVVMSALWALHALRRLRFSQDVEAPGMVEVDEGRVGYLGPTFGGFVAVPDMVELRIITVQGRRLWRLKQNDGQALLIPVASAGSDRLFDAFTSLPGMDTQALVEAASGDAGDGVIWQRRQAATAPRPIGN
ncbi:MAG: hypothetical protein DI533_13925 [Cereibacter sphaeroides]|uniref:Uncharacterized protein n=1 Tax=Cereibacter sphaeroides TaxID=1063 RepID=A0A2W5SBU1_CERSP|nr:MAG: hypothetical protein DI533_13925 [Cereibacter sphaeroides]